MRRTKTMSGYILKAAGRDATCAMDWRRGYLGSDETVAADLGWTIYPQTQAELTVVAQDVDATRSTARFAGGAPGRVYMIASRVRTTRGRVLERAIVLRIALDDGGH
jgi:hypothetical protein